MKFKKWLKNEMVGTAVLHGGIGESPGENINSNMPVRSRFSTMDASSKDDEDLNPERVFGFRKKDRKKRDRSTQFGHLRGRFPLSLRNPASIGFSQQ